MTRGHSSDLRFFKASSRDSSFSICGGHWQPGQGSRSQKGNCLPRALKNIEFSSTCPVGLPIGTNHPGEIAVSIAAQLLQVRQTSR